MAEPLAQDPDSDENAGKEEESRYLSQIYQKHEDRGEEQKQDRALLRILIAEKEIDAYDEIGSAETLRLNLNSVAKHLGEKNQEKGAQIGNSDAV